MNRNIAIAVFVAAAASSAIADDITVEPTPFVSTATTAQIRAELKAFKQSRVNPWSMWYNPLSNFQSTRTRADVVAEFISNRDQVAAFGAEDSGSAYLARHGSPAGTATRLAGQPRNPR